MQDLSMIIAGAGPAGLTAAITLAARGYSVTLCAESTNRQFLPGETLAFETSEVLRQLGVLSSMEEDAAIAFRGDGAVQCWGTEQPIVVSNTPPSWHISRAKLDEMLLLRAQALGVRFLANVSVRQITLLPESCEIQVRDEFGNESILTASFFVDASGRKSLMQRTLGNPRISKHRLVATRSLLEDHPKNSRLLHIETHASGWASAIPIPGGKLVVTYYTDADLQQSLSHPSHNWRENFPLIASRMTDCRPCYPPKTLAAHASHSSQVIGARWIAIGDAAATFDPLTSCGLHFAFGSAMHAADAIELALNGRFSQAKLDYESRLFQFLGQVRRKLHNTYAAEERWSDFPFWNRRHSDRINSHRIDPLPPGIPIAVR